MHTCTVLTVDTSRFVETVMCVLKITTQIKQVSSYLVSFISISNKVSIKCGKEIKKTSVFVLSVKERLQKK